MRRVNPNRIGALDERDVIQKGYDQQNDGYFVRMHVTAKSGEQGTVLWALSGSNRVVSCVESKEDGGEQCTTVHPRHSPDAVLAGYMAAMQGKNFVSSQGFCAWNPGSITVNKTPSRTIDLPCAMAM